MSVCPTTLTTIAKGCNNGVGGIKRVLIGLKDDFDVTVSSGKISAITKKTSGSPMVEYYFRRNTADYTSTLTVADDAGTSYWATDINLQFSHIENTKRVAIQSAVNAEAVVVIELFDGAKIFFGYDEAVTCTAGTVASGKAKGDFTGYTLTLHDESVEIPYHLDDDLDLDDLKA